jgi:hypothetical protein
VIILRDSLFDGSCETFRKKLNEAVRVFKGIDHPSFDFTVPRAGLAVW